MQVSFRCSLGDANPGAKLTDVVVMSRGETESHLYLKTLSIEWAVANRLPIVGSEVRIPKSPYRADAVAMSRRPVSEDAMVALFECKQSRADFLKDQTDEPLLKNEARAISERLDALRILIAEHRPDLRRGESLFAEFDSYDLSGLRHETFHGLSRDLEVMQRKLLNGVKFSRLHKYHAADFLYLVTEPDILEPHEIPVGWGWLVREGETLKLVQPPAKHAVSVSRRLEWLENVALTKRGIPFKKKLTPPEPLDKQ